MKSQSPKIHGSEPVKPPKPVKLGSLKLSNPLILAPMSGVNCAAFRRMCLEAGAGLAFTGMIEEDKDLKSRKIDFSPYDRPLAVQIVGGSKEKLGPMVEGLQARSVKIIDFNAGCPKNRYTKVTWGGWYTKNPDKLEEILGFLREKISCAFTLKTRLGFKRPHETYLQILKICEDIGMDGIALHGRYVSDLYKGQADWEAIKFLKEKSSIPVIGNGDVSGPADARRLMQFTCCDAVMIGRAATGNPFIFSQSLACLSGKDPGPQPALEDRLQAFRKFAGYYREAPRHSFRELRSHAVWFMNRAAGSKKMRIALRDAKDEEGLMAALDL